MELYSDHTVLLNYDPAHDILTATLQVRRAYDAAEVRRAFISIASCVREYHICCLLLDFTANTLDLTEDEYKYTMAQLTVALLRTPLHKVARIETGDTERERKILNTFEHIKEAVSVPVTVRTFPSREEAYRWLLSGA